MTKDELSRVGLALAKEFIKENDLGNPSIKLHDVPNKYSNCGLYRYGVKRIDVWIPSCARQNSRYSFPGLFCDRTPYGVINHELGHHVEEELGNGSARKIRKLSGEERLTSYCPDSSEWFAEMMRLFITNPDLLSKIRPKTYDAILSYGVRPVVNLGYKEVLQKFNASDYVLGRADKKIEEASQAIARAKAV